MNKMLRWLLPLVLIALVIWSFGWKQNAAPAAVVPKKEVVDSAGRRVMVPVRPQRVVALNASNLDLYYAAGGTVIGRPTTVALSAELLGQIRDIPQIGETSAPNLEKIMALRPDLILGVDVPFHHMLLPALEKAGIPILLQTLPDYGKVLETIRFYGTLTGNQQKTGSSLAEIERKVGNAKQKTIGKPAPRVLVVWGSPESFNMAMPTSFVGNLVEMLGGINVAAGASPTADKNPYMPLSLEYVARADADVILLVTHGADDRVNEKFRKELASHPAWQGMKAVRAGRVHKLPYQLFAVNPGTQVGIALELLATYLYTGEK